MNDKEQARKYLLTINNPLDHGMTHETLKDILSSMNCDYWGICDEVGEHGTPHTHVYFTRKSPIRFRTVKDKFPTAHIDKAYGSSSDNRDYLRKEGKWAETKKAETSVEGSFEEWGVLPDEAMEQMSVHEKMIKLIQDGETDAEIIRELPQIAYHVKDLDFVRQALLAEKYKKEFREVTVTYIYGSSTADLTGLIYSAHDASSIYRITSYTRVTGGHSIRFDQYYGEPVVVFEKYHGQISVEELLPLLDRYPLYLPARYADKVACYTRVYFTSDIPPEKQYFDSTVRYSGMRDKYNSRLDNIVRIDDLGELHVLKGTWEGGDKK